MRLFNFYLCEIFSACSPKYPLLEQSAWREPWSEDNSESRNNRKKPTKAYAIGENMELGEDIHEPMSPLRKAIACSFVRMAATICERAQSTKSFASVTLGKVEASVNASIEISSNIRCAWRFNWSFLMFSKVLFTWFEMHRDRGGRHHHQLQHIRR